MHFSKHEAIVIGEGIHSRHLVAKEEASHVGFNHLIYVSENSYKASLGRRNSED